MINFDLMKKDIKHQDEKVDIKLSDILDVEDNIELNHNINNTGIVDKVVLKQEKIVLNKKDASILFNTKQISSL